MHTFLAMICCSEEHIFKNYYPLELKIFSERLWTDQMNQVHPRFFPQQFLPSNFSIEKHSPTPNNEKMEVDDKLNVDRLSTNIPQKSPKNRKQKSKKNRRAPFSALAVPEEVGGEESGDDENNEKEKYHENTG
jgi:hypothetical protein